MDENTSTGEWYEDRVELVGFGHKLAAADYLSTPRDVLDYVESPMDWNRQHRLWESVGRPGTTDGQRWDLMLDLFERVDEDPTQAPLVAVTNHTSTPDRER